VTGNDWDYTPITIPPEQAQFIESQKLSANQVAAIYGIDPDEIGGEAANGLTYSNEESRQIKRAANMRPYLVRFERAFASWLPDREYVKFHTDATIRPDIKTRWEVNKIRLDAGAVSLNEIRAQEDERPIPGGDFGDRDAGKRRDLAETLQKIYLAVGTVITTDEAREIANAAGADLKLGVDIRPPEQSAPETGRTARAADRPHDREDARDE
jgi:hypothetical protein